LELLYIAKNDSDAFACATLAQDLAQFINTRRSSRQRRQAAQTDSVDPIFNFMTVASPLEQEMLNSTTNTTDSDGTGDNSGVVINQTPCTLILVLAILLKLIM